MGAPTPSLTSWDHLTEAEARSHAHALSIPRFTLDRVTPHAQGDAARFVAIFRHDDGAEFALLPGGERVLGREEGVLPVLDAEGERSWAASMASHGFPRLEEHLRSVMVGTRTMTLGTLLVERTARALDEIAAGQDHAGLLASLQQDGFRMLTGDEWEHACAAGTRTLWRWGNACPADELPEPGARFSELSRPNAFGLSIGQDPYRWEYVMEPGTMRGGDGGDALCGGYGSVAAWLACASSYVWPMFDADSYLDEGFVRRVVELT